MQTTCREPRRRWTRALTVAAALVGTIPGAGVRGAELESPGPLRADRYLAPEQMSGPDWKVAPEATTDGFGVDYTVTSRFGSFPAHGRTQVAMRIREIQALAQLETVSKSDVFVDAVKRSATAPLVLVASAAAAPVETLKGVPSGVGRWLKKTSFQVKEGYHDAKQGYQEVKQATAGSGESGDGGGASKAQLAAKGKDEATKVALDYLKISGAELGWYARLGVDPYTDNQLLRDAVKSVARVEGLTSFGMKFVGLPGIPGAREIRKTMDLVWKTDPWELRLQNRKKLLAAGLSEETARAFEDNPYLSLSQQTALLGALDELAGVAGRQHVISRAIGVESREEGSVLLSSTALTVRLHRQQEPPSPRRVSRCQP